MENKSSRENQFVIRYMKARPADGVIIGFAFIRLLEQTEREDWHRAIKGFVWELR